MTEREIVMEVGRILIENEKISKEITESIKKTTGQTLTTWDIMKAFLKVGMFATLQEKRITEFLSKGGE